MTEKIVLSRSQPLDMPDIVEVCSLLKDKFARESWIETRDTKKTRFYYFGWVPDTDSLMPEYDYLAETCAWSGSLWQRYNSDPENHFNNFFDFYSGDPSHIKNKIVIDTSWKFLESGEGSQEWRAAMLCGFTKKDPAGIPRLDIWINQEGKFYGTGPYVEHFWNRVLGAGGFGDSISLRPSGTGEQQIWYPSVQSGGITGTPAGSSAIQLLGFNNLDEAVELGKTMMSSLGVNPCETWMSIPWNESENQFRGYVNDTLEPGWQFEGLYTIREPLQHYLEQWQTEPQVVPNWIPLADWTTVVKGDEVDRSAALRHDGERLFFEFARSDGNIAALRKEVKKITGLETTAVALADTLRD